MRLHELAAKYGTDKLQHGYMDFYEKYLPSNPKRILEIGVLRGQSIRMWKEYFPEAEIHGLDLFIEHPIPDINGVQFWQGSQTDALLLEKLRNLNFDCIFEDGSHNSRDQLFTFFGLYKKGMHYFAEDLHCCEEAFYRQGLPQELTIKHVSKYNGWNFSEDGKIGHFHLSL
jgi:hypothetical protein